MKRILGLTLLLMLLGTIGLAETNLNGAGATFPYPIYSKWFDEYHKQHPDVSINYQSKGSGAGIRQLTEGTVDFGASDGPMTDKQLQDAKEKRGTDILHIPTVLGAVVPAYNVSDVKGEIKFSGDSLAGIFLGKITKWNDPAIAKDNPGLKLPDKAILVIHRAEASGTSYIFTDFLSKVSPEWKSKVGNGTAVQWPTGLGQQGNEAVAGMIRQMDGAVGYVELIYALQNKIDFGPVKNAAGKFVKASLESTTAAAASVKEMPDDFRVSITYAPGEKAYPIASFTWLLIPAKWSDAGKEKVMVDYLNWMLDSGEKMTEPLFYAPLPKNVATKVKAKIKEIK
ncbi:MAG TPA: phosphate ABC transporter substrate-binding protein PstS [Candidatus Angelobacter sp.]|nr:phosphate ABC transporter substrate-binding protein PstS [Candidatus Angelobacter sp.]